VSHLQVAPFQQVPRRAFEQLGERGERGDFQALDRVTTQQLIGRRDRQVGAHTQLVRVGEAEALHVRGDDGQVPEEHEVQGNVKLPLAQISLYIILPSHA
jgi:hypothetical protein